MSCDGTQGVVIYKDWGYLGFAWGGWLSFGFCNFAFCCRWVYIVFMTAMDFPLLSFYASFERRLWILASSRAGLRALRMTISGATTQICMISMNTRQLRATLGGLHVHTGLQAHLHR